MHTSIHCGSIKALCVCVCDDERHTWDAMVNQWSALSVSTMASNAGVCACKKGRVKSEKRGDKKEE